MKNYSKNFSSGKLRLSLLRGQWLQYRVSYLHLPVTVFLYVFSQAKSVLICEQFSITNNTSLTLFYSTFKISLEKHSFPTMIISRNITDFPSCFATLLPISFITNKIGGDSEVKKRKMVKSFCVHTQSKIIHNIYARCPSIGKYDYWRVIGQVDSITIYFIIELKNVVQIHIKENITARNCFLDKTQHSQLSSDFIT